MKVDIIQLLIIFDELMKFPTNEELGVYWFTTKRPDGLVVTLSFSIYENYAGVVIHTKGTGIAHVHMKNCSEIRVLDEKKQLLEIVHDNERGRCFLAITGNSILSYSE